MVDLWERVSGLLRAGRSAVRTLAPLLTRLVIGIAFVQTGIGKWENFHDTVEFFSTLPLPAPEVSAALTATLETVGGAALIAGAGTSVFAALLSSTMVVALLTADRMSFLGALTGSGDQSLTEILPLMFLIPLSWLVAYGAGPVSLDFLLGRRIRVRALGSREALA